MTTPSSNLSNEIEDLMDEWAARGYGLHSNQIKDLTTLFNKQIVEAKRQAEHDVHKSAFIHMEALAESQGPTVRATDPMKYHYDAYKELE